MLYRGNERGVYESHGFILREGKRCPFLQKDGLCEMILNLGEKAICDVCTDTPRNFLEYGGVREISISPSCAEAGRLIFGSGDKVVFLTGVEEGELEWQEEPEDVLFGERIRAVRDYSIQILQERRYPVPERMGGFLWFGKEVQKRLNEEDMEGLALLLEREASEYISQALTDWERDFTGHPHRQYVSFQRRFLSYCSMDSINEEWEKYLTDMNGAFVEGSLGEENYKGAMKEYESQIKEGQREFEWEHLAVYFCFLMCSRCVDDWNFWGKVQFVAVSWLFVRDMDALRCYRERKFTREDRVDVMRIYAKEVEHSQDNLDFLEEEFLFEENYTFEELLGQLLES